MSSHESDTRVVHAGEGNVPETAERELGFKLKPETNDGSVPLREFMSQFNLIAHANRWSESTKTVALASSLREKTRPVLETVQDLETVDYMELSLKLEMHFGEGHLSQNYYSQFTNRRQRFAEDLAYSSDLERLSRLLSVLSRYGTGSRVRSLFRPSLIIS